MDLIVMKSNDYIVTGFTVPTNATFFKDLKIGDVLRFSCPIFN